MKNKTTNQITKEIKEENLKNLKIIINNENYDKLSPNNIEWGGGEVVITSNPERIFNPETGENDWFGRKTACTYVLTKHALILSKFFYYVDENLLTGSDYHLYKFMAFLAIDYINEFGDDNANQLLNHIYYGLKAYLKYYNWEIAKKDTISKFMAFFLTDKEVMLE